MMSLMMHQTQTSVFAPGTTKLKHQSVEEIQKVVEREWKEIQYETLGWQSETLMEEI